MPARRLVLPVVATVLLLATPGSANAARDSGDLYLQQATSGKLSGSKLVLKGISRRVTTFTDRPERRASSMTTSSFVSGFGRTFRKDPPNAALQIEGRSTKRDVALLELRRPRYNRRARTLTYRVRRLKRTTGGLNRLDRRADRGVKGRFGRATLFIDSGGAGDYFAIVLSAPPGGRTSLTLTNGAGFDPEEQSTIVPLTPNVTPELTIQGSTMSVTPDQNGATSNAAMLVMTWIDVNGGTLTGSASVPTGGTASITVGGRNTNLSTGPFSIPFD